MPGAARSAMTCLRGVLDPVQVARWRTEAEAALRAQAVASPPTRGGKGAAAWPNGLRLDGLSKLFDEVVDVVHGHPLLRGMLAAALGPRAVLLADHCWIRHQRAPGARLAGQTPHSWHQDGALGFDFNAGPPPYPRDALLPMSICWLPLVDCGADAPALGWFEPPVRQLLAPAALSDGAIRAELAALGCSGPEQHAMLAPGDALLFGGGLVHRTHATASMQHDRSSIELRWLPADRVPARLAEGRFLEVDLGA